MKWNNKYAHKWVSGAIRSIAELQDILDSGTEWGESVTLYGVSQSGFLNSFVIEPYSTVECRKTEITNTPLWVVTDIANHAIFIQDYGVSATGEYPASENHRLFSNKMHAENYSTWMKTDPTYIQDVKNWHARCNEMWKDFDEYDGDDGSDEEW